jgi:hypothetical protein
VARTALLIAPRSRARQSVARPLPPLLDPRSARGAKTRRSSRSRSSGGRRALFRPAARTRSALDRAGSLDSSAVCCQWSSGRPSCRATARATSQSHMAGDTRCSRGCSCDAGHVATMKRAVLLARLRSRPPSPAAATRGIAADCRVLRRRVANVTSDDSVAPSGGRLCESSRVSGCRPAGRRTRRTSTSTRSPALRCVQRRVPVLGTGHGATLRAEVAHGVWSRRARGAVATATRRTSGARSARSLARGTRTTSSASLPVLAAESSRTPTTRPTNRRLREDARAAGCSVTVVGIGSTVTATTAAATRPSARIAASRGVVTGVPTPRTVFSIHPFQNRLSS